MLTRDCFYGLPSNGNVSGVNVGELEAAVGLHQPSLSQHLGVLRDEGLVSTRREGKYMYYSLASVEVLSIMETLSNLYCGKVKGRLK